MGVHVEQVIITGDNTGYERSLQQSSAKTATATKSWTNSFKSFAGALKAIVAVEAVRYIAQFGAASIKAASDQAEELNKAKVIFGAAADSVVAFGETSAESFGLSKTAAFGAASAYGNILKVSGLTEEAAASMSLELVKLAADMASFNNIPMDDALERIRSGLVGEAEPLRTVGVLLSEARVKTEAYAAGIAKTGAELTEAEKVQARYQLILKDTADTQGDFARTSDGLANQQRILAAEFENLQAELGQVFLPIATEAIGVFLGLTEAAGPLIPLIDDALRIFVGYAALKFLPLLLRQVSLGFVGVGIAAQQAGLATTVGGLNKLTVGADRLRGSLSKLTPAKGLGLIALINGLVMAVPSAVGEITTSLEDLAFELGAPLDVMEAIKREVDEDLFHGWFDFAKTDTKVREMTTAWMALRAEGEELGLSVEELNQIFADNVGQLENERSSIKEFTLGVRGAFAAFEAGGKQSEFVTGAIEFFADAQDAGSSAALRFTQMLREQREQQRKAAEAAYEHADALNEQYDISIALAGGVLGLANASRDLQEAQRELNRLERNGKQDTDAYREAVSAVLDATLGVESATSGLAQEIIDGKTTFREAKGELRDYAREAGLSKDALHSFLTQALKPIADELRYLARIDGKQFQFTATMTAHGTGMGFIPGALATGGIARAASGMIARSPLLVGEGSYDTRWGKGAEAVTPLDDRGIQILSEALGLAMERAGGKGGGHGHPIVIDGYQIARALERDRLRRGTG